MYLGGKSLLNSVAKQVSQVPLSLSIRLGSLRGTVRLHIKPPPSDQLWFGFTSTLMWSLIWSLLLGNARSLAAIRETMVLPNCESVCIPWMLAEKNDWVPRNVAPFIWINQEAASDNAAALELLNSQLDAKTKIEAGRETSYNHPESKHQKTRNAEMFNHHILILQMI
ncbi:hypothetical protein NC653_038787 [Populus alba x Populus x berolinensis]|uniref:Uncharacterized protein n=1 Tax=Populus alba x Populus x berolinensis TaxID=444605 RepID=A0AAD6LHV1_9ROSI|nr:hypothetical protein NC653_038787 [Populus alba x Populus x berolinensis]